MRKLISDTAKWGELTVGPKIINRTVQKRMKSALQKIRSGQFAREFIREMKPPRTRYAQLPLYAEKHPIENVGARLRAMMAWRAKTEIYVRAARWQHACYRPNRRRSGFGPVRR